jgi:hypothetical protein
MTGSGFDVIGWQDQPDEFLDAVTRFGITPAQFTLTTQYWKAYAGKAFRDLSFCLAKGGDVKLAVPCHNAGETLNFGGRPLEFLGHDHDKKTVTMAFDELLRRAKESGARSISVADRAADQALSVTGAEAFRRHGVPACRLNAVIDLSLAEETIRGQMRESYKSLINQIRRDMTFVVLARENADKKLFDDFRLFHRKVAGRQTRPVESWETQFEMVAAGCAELVLGYVGSHGLVSSALFTDFGETTSYAVAVYDRELFANRSLAHANVYEGIIRAKRRRQVRFLLGNVPARGTLSDKEYSIGTFKKGFCDRLDIHIEWTIPVTDGGV